MLIDNNKNHKMNIQGCTGCSACFNICPTNAIKMEKNKYGFYYPSINQEVCIKCNLCKSVCEILSNNREYSKNRLIDAVYEISRFENEKERKKCQSGGISYAIGKYILENNGIVYGCVYSDNFKVIHKRIDDLSELKYTCGSKYVQSDITNTFKEVYKDLKKGNKVLYTGTSCYIEGLYRFLRKKKCPEDNLYTIDIICHGVTSPLILKEFILYLQNKYNSKLKSFIMRDKKYAPKLGGTLKFDNGIEIKENFYSDLFYSRLTLRNSCEMCRYSSRNKPADITIGDTIGLKEKYASYINPKDPSSAVIIHSKKGLNLICNLDLNSFAISKEEFNQPRLNYPSLRNPLKEKFWKEYSKYGFKYVFKKYTGAGGIKAKIYRKIMIKTKHW